MKNHYTVCGCAHSNFLILPEIRESQDLAQHLRGAARSRKKGKESNRVRNIYIIKCTICKETKQNYNNTKKERKRKVSN